MNRFLTLILLALCSVQAWGQAVPSWATGRNGSGYLQVNGGTAGTVTFASEYAGTSPYEQENTGCTPTDRVAYDLTKDGYVGRPIGSSCRTAGACPEHENDDLAHPVWADTRHRHVLVKNWDVKNAFKTMAGPHVDVTQVYDAPGWGGWFVMQDSVLKNSDDGLTQWQFSYNNACGSSGGRASWEVDGVLVQGLTLGYDAAFGNDCAVRSVINGDPCTQGNFWGTWDDTNTILWVVNLSNSAWPITLQQTWKKVVFVGSSLPNISGGNGGAGEFATLVACTGSPCSLSNKAWGPYPNIEAALAAGHAEPPFIRLSCSGWANTANCTGGGGSAPSAPTNFRTVWMEDLDRLYGLLLGASK